MKALKVIKGELPKRKEMKKNPNFKEAILNTGIHGFNQCLDEIETVEITEEDILKIVDYIQKDAIKCADDNEILEDDKRHYAKAIISKLGASDK